jgi:hypothetical protein
VTQLRFGAQVSADEVAQEARLRSYQGHQGHPTSPGPRDAWRRRRGLESPGNGVPGVPRYTSIGDHHPGIVYGSSGPKAPGVAYDNPFGEDRGDT